MEQLTQNQIQELELEINKFWEEPDSKEITYCSRDLIFLTYEELCNRLPFIPFTIIGNKVYLDGEIQLSFLDAMFLAIGETCKKYNNKELFIKYGN